MEGGRYCTDSRRYADKPYSLISGSMKKPLTLTEQMNLLKSRGLVINDEDKCLEFLYSVNYYLFSAYLLPFKQSNGNYKPGTSFETVLRIFEFDRKLRSLLFIVIEEIELFLRAQLAYYSAHTYGPHGYLDAKHYSMHHDHNRFIKTVNTAINNNRNTPVVMHHNAKYNGLFPIWVIVDYFSIGNLSYFYTDWLVNDKKSIAKDLFGSSYPFLDSWMKCITVLRNRCAHYSRLYFSLFTDLPKIPTKLIYTCTGRVFDQLMMLKLLYTNKARWNSDFVLSLKALIIEYIDDIRFAHIGFPGNWQELLEFDENISVDDYNQCGTRRIRTIPALAAHYKTLDEETAITEYFIRKNVLDGKIPHIMSGKKRLVAIEDVDRFLS